MIGLSIAGFDPSGGAGISTDIKTMAAHGVHACAIVSALTAQNPKKVFSVEPVALHSISEQIDSVFDEYSIKYSKTGLLYSKEIIQLVSKKVEEYDLSIVVDPVMVASAGDALAKKEIADYLKKYLLKKTLLVTPNVSEAEKLSEMKIESVDDAKKLLLNYKNMINEEEYDEDLLGELNVYDEIYKQPNRKNCALLPEVAIEKLLGEIENEK